METFFQDLRYGFRNLLKTRGLTAVAIITLALGIGANTAIFSVIDAVLLRPLPFHEPGQLVRLYETESQPGNYPFAGADFLDWKTQNKSFQDMTLYSWPHDYSLTGSSGAERVIGVPAEANFFSLLGVQPALGRTFAQGEDDPGKDDVLVLSYALWQSRFGGQATVLNSSVELSGRKYTVIGVMPPTFHYPTSAQFWVPLPMDSKTVGQRGSHSYSALGRLKPGVSLQTAQAEMTVIAQQLEKQYPKSNYKVGASLVAMHEDVVGKSRDSLVMVLWAVGLVLLIACANVANLLLSRSLARQREMAIRIALGAARLRLMRQLLTESVMLATTGGVLGLGLASVLVKVMSTAKQLGVPRQNAIELNLPVLAFTFAVAVLSGIVFGIIPALQTSRPDLLDELKGGAGASVTQSRARRFTSNALVISEIGLSLLLLIAAGMLLKDFEALRSTDIGVRTEGTWTAAISLPAAAYKEDQKQFDFAQTVLQRVRQLPGVQTAALTNVLPTGGGSNSYVNLRGVPFQPLSGPLVESHSVTPGYFQALGIPILAGRDFNEQDVQRAYQNDVKLKALFKANPDVPPDQTDNVVYPVVINETMAKTLWPNENPLGKFWSQGSANGPWNEVIGVAGDVKQWGLVHAPVPEGYSPFDGSTRMFLVLHTTVAPASITESVRRGVTEIDRGIPLYLVRTMDQYVAEQAAGQQFVTTLVGAFAGLALLLAAVGIYGVLSYLVTQRTREIGIRMSLGAQQMDVLRLVIGHGAKLALAGCVVGIAGALAATKVLGSAMVMLKHHDPRIYVAAVIGLVAVALAACYVPARRAARVDPLIALRYE